jgi:hypothetical protein
MRKTMMLTAAMLLVSTGTAFAMCCGGAAKDGAADKSAGGMQCMNMNNASGMAPKDGSGSAPQSTAPQAGSHAGMGSGTGTETGTATKKAGGCCCGCCGSKA